MKFTLSSAALILIARQAPVQAGSQGLYPVDYSNKGKDFYLGEGSYNEDLGYDDGSNGDYSGNVDYEKYSGDKNKWSYDNNVVIERKTITKTVTPSYCLPRVTKIVDCDDEYYNRRRPNGKYNNGSKNTYNSGGSYGKDSSAYNVTPTAYDGGNSGAYDGGYPGAYDGGKPGAYDGGKPGAYNGGKPGAYDGGYPGAYDGGKPGAYNGGKPGAYDGGKPGAYNGGYPGAYDGGYPGAYDGGKPGAYDGGKPGAYNGGKPGAYNGGYPGAYDAYNGVNPVPYAMPVGTTGVATNGTVADTTGATAGDTTGATAGDTTGATTDGTV
ncbi:hypothetical protein BB561_004206 [Smittium simulii]|uniref:Uncharacterized protein n=1 Tax=Smittium simulii TaxID=133385 RepID=A0A2T9YHH9_9FUNG|nr:hypothetical protein BB561_004206 [Smittium simulii]